MFDILLWSALSVAAVLSAGHALLWKRDSRAALGWIVVCLVFPGFGAVLYWLLGVNRIRTRARDWQARGMGLPVAAPEACSWSAESSSTLPFGRENIAGLLNLSDRVTRRPLVPGNRVIPLHNGEQAFPAMLDAIASSCRSIHLCTYIFDSDRTGRAFVKSLKAAAERGVEVRILIDALGERYSFPPARLLFRGSKVQVARFLSPSISGRGINLNLRNHRKFLVVDDRLGFTGGMNIGDRHLAENRDNPRRVVDIHFRIEGPVVSHLQESFLEDWGFATGQRLEVQEAPPPVADPGAFCRGISAGPNEDFEKLHWILIGALNCAREKVRIMTPYFIPDQSLISALNSASLRGVAVEIILPLRNNLQYVAWATRACLWELLKYDIRIFFQPEPFVHSKLLLIDRHYALVGSANLDPRSLRLNFEFNMEIYERAFIDDLCGHFDRVRQKSLEETLAAVDSRPLPIRLRDSFAKLFSPYL